MRYSNVCLAARFGHREPVERPRARRGAHATRALFAFMALLLVPPSARADDSGPPHDAGAVRADARVLLAHRARLANVDPKQITISDVVVSGDRATLSWNIGKQHGLMQLVRSENRWWDTREDSHAATVPAPDLLIHPAGATLHFPRSQTSGYDVSLRFGANTAGDTTHITGFVVRPPTHAEFLPY